MSLKHNLLMGLRSAARSPILSPIFYHPSVRGRVQQWPVFRNIYGRGWELMHPFDLAHGTETSGFIPPDQLPNSSFATKKGHLYAGSQPSIIRVALLTLPPLDDYSFIDLGCGKGRPLLVASEFPFRELIGVELAESLAEIGQKNLTRFRKSYPGRAPMRIETGDACNFQFPAGNLVVFLYNPFNDEVMRRVITNIEAALDAESRSIFIIYYNPVCSACMDQSPRLKRYFAASLPYGDEERGFGPDLSDSVVIWQGGSDVPARVGASSSIVMTDPGSRAEVVP